MNQTDTEFSLWMRFHLNELRIATYIHLSLNNTSVYSLILKYSNYTEKHFQSEIASKIFTNNYKETASNKFN